MARQLDRDENGVIKPIKSEYPAMENARVIMNKSDSKFSFANENTEKENEADSGKPIGKEEISKAVQTLRRYMSSKKAYDTRYKENFDTYNLMYTESADREKFKDDDGVEHYKLVDENKIGAQTLHIILNKHADEMDNMPEPYLLPRAQDDEDAAKMLNSVIPCILDRNDFEETYSKEKTDKLVGGAGVYSVTWNDDLAGGLGDVLIDREDILRLFWAPHIENIQDSPHLFYVEEFEVETAKELFPQLQDISPDTMGLEEYRTYDSESKNFDKAVIVDWYYKKNGILHLCKFCGEQLLFASENEPESYPNGYYEHGLYPFVVEPCMRLKDTPVGFSYVDICRTPQRQLDGFKVDLLTNVKVNSRPRDFVNVSKLVNPNDLNDLSKEHIEVQCDPQGIALPRQVNNIANGSLTLYSDLKDEMKETTGCNDASNGHSPGVTSGSAIAALQEAGGKISRDGCKTSYSAYKQVVRMVLELIRQFYNQPRIFRITGEDNSNEYIAFDNTQITNKKIVEYDEEGNPLEFTDENGDILTRMPDFDIVIKAQKASPFATAANNEMMMTLYKMGAFAAENADAALIMLEGMSFEGKDKIVEQVKNNRQLLSALQDMQGKMQMMEAMLAAQAGEQAAGAMPGQQIQQGAAI